MGLRIIQTENPLTDKTVIALRDRLREGGVVSGRPGAAGNVRDIVAGIIKGVKDGGDTFVVKHTNDFHKVNLTRKTMRVSQQDIQTALTAAEPEFLELARRAIANIRHQFIFPWLQKSVCRKHIYNIISITSDMH